jgi:hypothetical protein
MAKPQLEACPARGELEPGEGVHRRRIRRQRAHVARELVHLERRPRSVQKLIGAATDEFRRDAQSYP